MTKRKRRTFTPEFKTKVVLEALCSESSQAQLCRRTPQSLYFTDDPENLKGFETGNSLTAVKDIRLVSLIWSRN